MEYRKRVEKLLLSLGREMCIRDRQKPDAVG